ncbi:MAG: hypothetical protein E7295_03740 [Lachnospiraceae bacterium]|jgi:spore cortex biosynthesis protein YabQ|nr:hypothetical protein [Lachnospiraceae bacterium]
MSQENLFMLHALEMGVFLAFVYDLLRVSRRVFPRGCILVSIEDLLYWCFCAGEILRLLHRDNHGILRWYAIFAAMAGIWAYLSIASPLFLKYATLVLKKLLTGLFGVIKIIGKGVSCHGRKKNQRKVKGSKGQCAKEKESCISKATAEPCQHVSGDACRSGDCCGDCHQCRGTSEKD